MGSSRLAVAIVSVLLFSACGSREYRQVEPVRFSTAAPRMITFDVLIRHAIGLGYVLDGADPAGGGFYVHSRTMGRPPRPGRRPSRSGPVHSNLFIVQVTDGSVEVRAFGRHVRSDGSMPPTLAAELSTFAASLQQAASSLAGGVGTMPGSPSTCPPGYACGQAAPPSAGGEAPSPVPPPATTEPSPSPASELGAP